MTIKNLTTLLLVGVVGVGLYFVGMSIYQDLHEENLIFEATDFHQYFKVEIPKNSAERAARTGDVKQGLILLAYTYADIVEFRNEAVKKFNSMKFDTAEQRDQAKSEVKDAERSVERSLDRFNKARDLAKKYGFSVKETTAEYQAMVPNPPRFVLGMPVTEEEYQRYRQRTLIH